MRHLLGYLLAIVAGATSQIIIASLDLSGANAAAVFAAAVTITCLIALPFTAPRNGRRPNGAL